MKRVFILFLYIFVAFFAKSNEIATGYFTGKVFLINGDTLTTKIHLSYYKGNFIKNLYMDNFGHYLDAKNKVRGLNANKIKGFEVKIDSIVSVFVSKNKSKNDDKKIFYHLLNGKNSTVKLFEFYNKDILASSLAIGLLGAWELADVQYAIEYKNGTNKDVFYFPKRKDFRYDKFAFILSDNKDIEKKIEDMVYKYDDIPLIIDEYNNWYSKK
jgi:hypothetical protein